jgi:hypothetical protein
VRYTYKAEHPCPKNCGSTDMRVFGYCCARSVDIVCQVCGATAEVLMYVPDPAPGRPHKVKTTPEYAELSRKMTLEGPGELGFIGKIDAREEFHEAFPDKIPPVRKPC